MTSSLAMYEDRTLVELALAGQMECFSVLMNRHKSAVRRRIRSIVRNATDTDARLHVVIIRSPTCCKKCY
jgi:hypothetical protein